MMEEEMNIVPIAPIEAIDPVDAINPVATIDPLEDIDPIDHIDPLESTDPQRMLWKALKEFGNGMDIDTVLVTMFISTFTAIILVMAYRLSVCHESTFSRYLFRRTGDDRAPFNSECPVCLDDLTIGAEGNCGHVYCTNCIKELDRRRNWRLQIRCPMCRQRVQILFKYTRDNSIPDDPELVNLINSYNSWSLTMYPHNILDTIRNMPILLRHLLHRFMENGFRFDQMLSSFVILISISIVYFFLPTDLFPELVFGIYGLIDDFFVAFYCLFQICIFYRNFLAHNGET